MDGKRIRDPRERQTEIETVTNRKEPHSGPYNVSKKKSNK
jgi:hypothetical protein